MAWDPSIILGGRQYTGPDANETMRTLSQLATQGVQRQQAQFSLADMARQQGRRQTLEDLVGANGQDMGKLSSALYGRGFLDEGNAAQDRQVSTERRASELREHGKSILRSQAAVVKTPEQYAQFIAHVPPQVRAELGLPDAYDEDKLQMFIAPAVSAEKRAELDQKDRAAGMRVTDTGTGQRMGFNPETGKYDIAIGAPKPPKPAGDGGGAGGSGLSPEALESAAKRYHETGEMIPSGAGKGGTAIKTAVLNRAAEIYPDDSIGGNKGDYHANAASLKKLQTQADFMQSFEDTALKNLDTAIEAASKIPDVGGSLFNKPVRAWANMLGNTDMSAYKAALTTARAEISKVLSGSTGSGAVSDSARHEVEELMGNDASLKQLKSAATILRKDMGNRKTAVEESIATIRGRMGAKKTRHVGEGESELVTVRRKSDGVTKTLPAAGAQKYLSDPAFEQVK